MSNSDALIPSVNLLTTAHFTREDALAMLDEVVRSQAYPLSLWTTQTHSGMCRFDVLLEKYMGKQDGTGGQNADTYLKALYLAKLMGNQGEVRIISRRATPHDGWDDFGEAEERLSENLWINRVWAGPRTGNFSRNFMRNYVGDMVMQATSELLLPHFVLGNYVDGGMFARLMQEQNGVPYSFQGHSFRMKKIETLISEGKGEDVAKQELPQNASEEVKAMKASDVLFAHVGEEVVDQYHRYTSYSSALGGRRVECIPPGINEEVWIRRPLNPDLAHKSVKEIQGPVALYALHRFDRKKNPHGTIDGFGYSQARRNGTVLVMFLPGIGKARRMQDPLAKDIDATIRRHNLQQGKDILIIDDGRFPLTEHTVKWVSRHGGCVLNPALEEPFGLAIREMGATGLPVVMTQNSGQASEWGEGSGGVTVDPASPESIAAGIDAAITNQEAWAPMAAKTVQKFDYERTAIGFLGFICQVLLGIYNPYKPYDEA
jgi:sucrose-phosphate synthase